jgi:hypothetical protein
VSAIRTGTVTSADGTIIVFDQSGEGPAVVLVQGALMGRADPVMSGIAAGLSHWFTVFSYDRRGRGDSGDTRPYAVQREAEDLAALIAAAAPAGGACPREGRAHGSAAPVGAGPAEGRVQGSAVPAGAARQRERRGRCAWPRDRVSRKKCFEGLSKESFREYRFET